MNTRVKICGMKQEKDIEIAVQAGADAVGFVTDVPVETPRNLSVEEARELIRDVPPFVTSVLVIMPPNTE
ncbi:MAG: phosphoribosylanthranilate isomerase, partial [Halobacteria archaeon]|nr:phosphoribosylanthranilate isomerase [Halobacteria archaeon]